MRSHKTFMLPSNIVQGVKVPAVSNVFLILISGKPFAPSAHERHVPYLFSCAAGGPPEQPPSREGNHDS